MYLVSNLSINITYDYWILIWFKCLMLSFASNFFWRKDFEFLLKEESVYSGILSTSNKQDHPVPDTGRTWSPKIKILIHNLYFWRLLSKSFKSYFERFSVTHFLGGHKLWRETIAWSYVNIIKLGKHYLTIEKDVWESG